MATPSYDDFLAELRKRNKPGTPDSQLSTFLASDPEMEADLARARRSRMVGDVSYATTQHRGRTREVGRNIDPFGDLTTYKPGGVGDGAPRPGQQALPRSPDVPVTGVGSGETEDSEEIAAAAINASPYGRVPEKSKIDPVTDRFQQSYDAASKALQEYNQKYFGKEGVSGTAGAGGLARYNSPERGQLIRQQRQQFRLLQGGSFADQSNIQREARQNQAAQASAALANIPYKEALGKAALSNMDIQKAAAEELLAGDKKRKKGPYGDIDMDKLRAAINLR